MISGLVHFVVWVLEKVPLKLKHRIILTTAILTKLSALPLRDIIKQTEEGLEVDGKIIDMEKARLLREGARIALQSQTLSLIRSQVLFKAFQLAAHTSINMEQLFFAKAAIWWGEQEDALLKLLAGELTAEPDL